MRRTLAVCCALTVLVSAEKAWAQIPVTDLGRIAQSTAQQLQTMAQWSEQARNMATQIATLNAQLNQARAAYAAVTGVRDLGSAMAALNMVGIQNPLPIDAYALQGILSGQGGLNGMSGNLGNLFTSNVAANRLYDSGGTDWRSQDLRSNANSLAGIQAVSQAFFTTAQQRLTQLAGLRLRQQTASDPKTVADLQAATAIVQADIASQAQQMQAFTAMAEAQPAIRTQRDEENERRCIDKLIAYYSGKSASPVCGPPVATGPVVNASYGNGVSGSGTATQADGSSALNTMLSREWGQAAADNATRLGVNPSALAATCVIESGCQNVTGTGTVSGAFQMTNSTFTAAAQRAGASTDLAGKMNPAVQSIAASQELKSAALSLQQRGIVNPTVLDTRAIYQWGAGAGPALARADPATTMAAALPAYGAATLAANGIRPGQTVGEWRADVANKIGPAAYQPVLLTQGAA